MKYTCICFCLAISLKTFAQPMLLPTVQVTDSLLAQHSVGHHVTKVQFQNFGQDVAQQLNGKSPIIINQAGPGLLANQTLRGVYTDAIQVFWNGMPVNAPTLGLSDLNVFNPATLSTLTVLPGGSGAELGSGSFGGSVFLENALSPSVKNGQELMLGVGSYGQRQFVSKTTFSHQKTTFSVTSFYDGADYNFSFQNPLKPTETLRRDNHAFNRYGIQASSKTNYKKVRYESHLLLQDLFRELPSATSAINQSNPTKAWQADQMLRWQNIVVFNGWRLEQGFAVEKQRFNDSRFSIDDANNFYQSSSEIRKVLLKNSALSWNAGAYVNAYRAFGDNVEANQFEYGLRSALTHRLSPRLLYKISLSADFVNQQTLTSLDTSRQRILPILSALALQYKLNKHVLLRGNVAQVFNNPTLNERYWPGGGLLSIQPENGLTSEIGFDYLLEIKNWSLKTYVTAYYLYMYNRVRWISTENGVFSPRNISESYSTGVEFAEHITYTHNLWELSLQLNANYTKATVVKDDQLGEQAIGKQLRYIPLFNGGTQLNLTYSRVSLYLSGVYNSGAFTTSDNDVFFKLNPFLVLNTGIAYTQKFKRFMLKPSFHVLNVTNVEYQTQPFQPMPGRNFNFNIQLSYQL